MSARLLHCAALLLSIATGCSGREALIPVVPVAGSEALQGKVMISQSDGSIEGITGGWTITLDATQTVATVTPWRQATGPQGFLFDLDISAFLTPDMLQVTRIGFDAGENLRLDYRIRHPFRGPNFAKPVTAANRADLGVTGRMLFLFDVPLAQVPEQRFFGNNVVANTSTVLNPNHYVRPGDLLSQSVATFNADAFPARLIVDESLNGGQGNRVGNWNGGNPEGNYDASTGGWQRGNIGVNNNDWTGFDFLHQGQSADNWVVLERAALTGAPLQFDVALLAKYTDPRGASFVTNPNARMPQLPTDAALFAYRLPNGALDASDLAITGLSGIGTLEIDASAGEEATFGVQLRDWDARATASSSSVLSDDPDLSHVHPGTAGIPVVEVSAPSLSAAAFGLSSAGGESGLPGDELVYTGTLTNALGTAVAGSRHPALVRAVDPENSAPNRETYHFGVDPATLGGSPALAMELITYQSLIVEITSADFPAFVSVASWGSTTNDASLGAGVDAQGNLYSVGRFEATTDFDPGPAVENRTAVGNFDAYLLSLNPDGTFRWVSTWGGTSIEESVGVAIADDGTCFVSGYFTETCDFDPGAGAVDRTAIEGQDAYVLSLTNGGAFNWVAVIEGLENQFGARIAVDDSNRVYLSGSHSGITDFDPGPAVVTGGTNGFKDAFLVGLDGNGLYRNSAGWGGTLDDAAFEIALDSQGRPSVAGEFMNTVDFDPGAATVNRISAGDSDAFVLSLDLDADYLGVATWGGTALDRARGLAVDGGDNLYCSGFYSGDVDFDPGAGLEPRSSAGGFDGFLLALTPALGFRWVASIGGTTDDFGREVICDVAGNTYQCGDFTGTVDLDPGVASDARASAGGIDAFLIALDPTGAYRVGVTFGAGGSDLPTDVVLAGGDTACFVGNFSQTVDFHPGAGVAQRTSLGALDSFGVRLRY